MGKPAFVYNGSLSRRDQDFYTKDFAERMRNVYALENLHEVKRDFPVAYGKLEILHLIHKQHHGFKVRRYRSGEMTGAEFMTGRQGKIIPNPRTGKVTTDKFTQHARTTIRRATECSDVELKYFCTLSFAPSKDWEHQEEFVGPRTPGRLSPWHHNEDGTVRHDYAKDKIKRFLNSCSVNKKRLGQELKYVWVAELQGNGNIHFHILWNLFFAAEWTRKIWGVGAVNFQTIKDTRHAVNYMRKYMTKDENARIEGNRYFVSHSLRATMQPEETTVISITHGDIQEGGSNPVRDIQDTIKAMREEIEGRGGKVLDFGFYCPAPRRSQRYRDEKGRTKQTKGVRSDLADNVLQAITSDEESPF